MPCDSSGGMLSVASPTLVIGTHFAGSAAGRLVRDDEAYRLDV